MKIKVFDFEHEADLEIAVNKFLEGLPKTNFIDIKYQTSHFNFNGEQIYSFSVLILYK